MCLLNIHKIITCLYLFLIQQVRTETLTIFCVMIPLLVDTWPDFGLFRVVRPYSPRQASYGLTTLNRPKSREVSTNDGIITHNLFNAAVPTSSETK